LVLVPTLRSPPPPFYWGLLQYFPVQEGSKLAGRLVTPASLRRLSHLPVDDFPRRGAANFHPPRLLRKLSSLVCETFPGGYVTPFASALQDSPLHGTPEPLFGLQVILTFSSLLAIGLRSKPCIVLRRFSPEPGHVRYQLVGASPGRKLIFA